MYKDIPLSCENCTHIIIENNSQIGCSYNLLEVLDGEKDGDFYILDRVCLFKNKTMEEIDIKLGYIFILNESKDIDIFKNNIESIKDKNPTWIGVSINDTIENNIISKILNSVKCKYNIISNSIEIDNIYKLDQFIKNYKNGWTFVNIVGEYFDYEAKEKLQNFILGRNGKAAIIKDSVDPDEMQINGICYYNYIFKYLNGSKPELSEDGTVYYTKSFAHKVSEKSQNMIIKWSDV